MLKVCRQCKCLAQFSNRGDAYIPQLLDYIHLQPGNDINARRTYIALGVQEVLVLVGPLFQVLWLRDICREVCQAWLGLLDHQPGMVDPLSRGPGLVRVHGRLLVELYVRVLFSTVDHTFQLLLTIFLWH